MVENTTGSDPPLLSGDRSVGFLPQNGRISAAAGAGTPGSPGLGKRQKFERFGLSIFGPFHGSRSPRGAKCPGSRAIAGHSRATAARTKKQSAAKNAVGDRQFFRFNFCRNWRRRPVAISAGKSERNPLHRLLFRSPLRLRPTVGFPRRRHPRQTPTGKFDSRRRQRNDIARQKHLKTSRLWNQ